MAERPRHGERGQGERMDRIIAADLEALRQDSGASLPTAADTRRALRRAPHEGGMLMTAIERFSRRPRLAVVLGGAALLLGLGLWPVSWQRTVGHDVQLRLSGPGLHEREAGRLARQLRGALRAAAVQFRAAAGPGGTTYTLVARLPTRSRAEAERLAEAAVQGISARSGLRAEAEVRPRLERAAGTVYAMAVERVIQIRVDMAGKTDRQVEDEIRAQLQAAGVPDPEVQVERRADETRVEIGAEQDGRQMHIVRRQQGGAAQLQMEIGDLDDHREPGMTDAQLKEKIERQLRARGLDPEVTVSGDRIEVRAHGAKDEP